MKKVFIILSILILSSCIGYIPEYYDTREALIPVYGLKITDNVKAYVDDEPAEITTSGITYTFDKGHNFHWDKKCIDNKKECSIYAHLPKIKVNRLQKDRKLKLSREGYEDLYFALKSQLTDEKWAKGYGEFIVTGEAPAAVLLVPSNTLSVVYALWKGLRVTFEDPLFGIKMTTLSLAGLPVAMVVDVYNVSIGLPSTAIINPWYNYRIEPDPYSNVIIWQKIKDTDKQ